MFHSYYWDRRSHVIEGLTKTRFIGNLEQQPYDTWRPAPTTFTGCYYQRLALTVLFLGFGLEKKVFELKAEDAKAQDFDDVVLSYKGREPTEGDTRTHYNDFFQMKYICDENTKITYEDLCKPIDKKNRNKFSLAKYFLTFLRIRSDPRFSSDILDKFIICTNIGFDQALERWIVKQDRHSSYLLDCPPTSRLYQDLRRRFQEGLEEKVLQKGPEKNPYSSIEAEWKNGEIVIHERIVNEADIPPKSIEELMDKFFRDLRFLTGMKIDNCEQRIEQIIQEAVGSKSEYIAKYFVPSAIHYVQNWFCGLRNSPSVFTQEEAQNLLSGLTKDFFDIFMSNQQAQSPSHHGQQPNTTQPVRNYPPQSYMLPTCESQYLTTTNDQQSGYASQSQPSTYRMRFSSTQCLQPDNVVYSPQPSIPPMYGNQHLTTTLQPGASQMSFPNQILQPTLPQLNVGQRYTMQYTQPQYTLSMHSYQSPTTQLNSITTSQLTQTRFPGQ